MKIACLGWGSLVWRPECLAIRQPWFSDGPLLPIEFARHSNGDRITLVLVPRSHPIPVVRSLWAIMSVVDKKVAIRELAQREGIEKAENIAKHIGHWSPESNSGGDFADDIGIWASSKGLDAVVWTALPPKFDGEENKVPSTAKVVGFLRKLSHEKRKNAEEYIRKAPVQIDTEYRRKIERELGWTPMEAEMQR